MSDLIYLETERLILRRFTGADVENLRDLDSDPEVMRFVSDGLATTRERVAETILPRLLWFHENYESLGFWAVIEREAGEFIGWFHLRPFEGSEREAELGYRFRRSAWGKGYATEGSRALVRKGFRELDLARIVACAMAENAASIRVMQKVGLTLDRRWIDQPLGGQELVRYAIDGGDVDSTAGTGEKR